MSYYYLDDDRAVQGPFTGAELNEWRAAGYFTADTLLLPADSGVDITREESKQTFRPFRAFFPDNDQAQTQEITKDAKESVAIAVDDAAPAAVAAPVAAAEPNAAAKPASPVASAPRAAVPPPPPPRPTPPPAPVQPATAAPAEAPATADSVASPAAASSTATTAAAAAPAAVASEWYYLDDAGDERGPFSASDMSAWFTAGFFTGATKVRTASESSCRPVDARTAEDESFLQTKAAVINPEDEFEVDMDDDEEEEEEEDDDEDLAAGDDKGDTEEKKDDADTTMVDAPPAKPTVAPEKLPWFYTDKDGVIRGPFAPSTMLKWHRLGFFAFNNTPLRREDETDPTPLSLRTIAPSFFTALPPPPPPSTAKENRWYYLDTASTEHGPFTEAEMRAWWDAGFLKPTLRVRQVGESEDAFSTVASRDCAFTRPPIVTQPLLPMPMPQPTHQQMMPHPYAAAPYPPHPYAHAYPPMPYPGAAPYAHGYSYPGPVHSGAPPPPPPRGARPDYSQSAGFSTRGGRGLVAAGRLAEPTDASQRQAYGARR